MPVCNKTDNVYDASDERARTGYSALSSKCNQRGNGPSESRCKDDVC